MAHVITCITTTPANVLSMIVVVHPMLILISGSKLIITNAVGNKKYTQHLSKSLFCLFGSTEAFHTHTYVIKLILQLCFYGNKECNIGRLISAQSVQCAIHRQSIQDRIPLYTEFTIYSTPLKVKVIVKPDCF